MYDYVAIINTAGSALMALALGWAVLNPGLRNGVVMQLGLSLMALGFLAIACVLLQGADGQTIARAGVLIYTGAAIAVCGWALRTRGGRTKLRRVTDWRGFYGHAAPRNGI